MAFEPHAGCPIALHGAAIQRPRPAGRLGQRTVKLELQNVGQEIAHVRDVGRHVILGSGSKSASLRSGHGATPPGTASEVATTSGCTSPAEFLPRRLSSDWSMTKPNNRNDLIQGAGIGSRRRAARRAHGVRDPSPSGVDHEVSKACAGGGSGPGDAGARPDPEICGGLDVKIMKGHVSKHLYWPPLPPRLCVKSFPGP